MSVRATTPTDTASVEDGGIALARLPRRGLHRRLVMLVGGVAVAQAVVTAACFAWMPSEAREALHALQVPTVIRQAEPAFIPLATGLGVTLVVMLPIAYVWVRRWTSGLGRLHVSIRRLSKGLEPLPIPVSGDDEVAYLSLAFNDMAGRLVESQTRLMTTNATLEQRVADRTDDLKRANRELDRTNARLNEITENALRFADDVAHEFRTPVAVIKEFASLMSDGVGGAVTPKQQKYLTFVEHAASDLAMLLDDFLDSSKLRARALRVDRRSHDVSGMLDLAWPILEAEAREHGVQLRRDTVEGLPPVYADDEKVRRVLVNLVVNAIKFSEDGGIVTIGARAMTGGDVEFSVRDRGKGMGPEEVAHLFGRFRQGREGVRSSFKGFGLGLCIVREMVDVNLGSVSVASERGSGSVFSFTLPAATPERVLAAFVERAQEHPTGKPCVALRVCAEDNVDELYERIIAGMRPHDLALFADDARSLVLVGECANPDAWADRTREVGAITVEHIGTWRAGEFALGELPPVDIQPPQPCGGRRCA